VLGHAVAMEEAGLRGGHLRGGALFGPVNGVVTLTAGSVVTAVARGHRLHPRALDHTPPLTRVTVKRKGKFAVLAIHAHDESGVAQTIVTAGGKLVRLTHGHTRIRRSQLASVRFYSVDVFGNRERVRRLW
jgi:hypothetical protein